MPVPSQSCLMKPEKKTTTVRKRTDKMQSVLNADESYAERRQLFKNIWGTAVDMDNKKPKLIQTLRLDCDERDKKTARQKEKLKNLRHVCNKILDFCDKREAEQFVFDEKAEEAADEGIEIVTSKTKRRKKYKRHSYGHRATLKIKYKHPPPPLAIGDYNPRRHSIHNTKPDTSKKKSSKKTLKSDYQFTASPADSTSATGRKRRTRKKRRIKKLT